VNQQRFVYLGQTPENGGIGGHILADFDERTNEARLTFLLLPLIRV
jgi:hypothetical protein